MLLPYLVESSNKPGEFTPFELIFLAGNDDKSGFKEVIGCTKYKLGYH